MDHKYSSKFRNKNIPYAKVGLRVFRSLFDAETYCAEKGLDVDSAIEYGESPELKTKVQEIALIQKAVLRGLRDALDGCKARVNTELSLAVKARDQAEKSRDLLLDYYKGKVLEVIAKGDGLYEAQKTVTAMLEDLEWLTGWRG